MLVLTKNEMRSKSSKTSFVTLAVACAGCFVQGASALLPSFSFSGTRTPQRLSLRDCTDVAASSKISASPSGISGAEFSPKVTADDDDTKRDISHSTMIATHLGKASLAQSQGDAPTQLKEMEYVERALVQWVEDYRVKRSRFVDAPTEQSELPGYQVFCDVIEGMLALPSSFAMEGDEKCDVDGKEEETNDQIRDALLRKRKSGKDHLRIHSESNKSDRATYLLDLMESFHEPTGSLYDTIIASHGVDSLQLLSYFLATEKGEEEDEDELKSKKLLFYQQAWKSAKSALQLLNR